MSDYPINSGVQITAEPKITIPTGKGAAVDWFDESIVIQLSSPDRIAAIVVDFSYSLASVIQYTLNGDAGTPVWVPFNNGVALSGGQSRFIRVTDGNQLNFRGLVGATVNRCIVSIP